MDGECLLADHGWNHTWRRHPVTDRHTAVTQCPPTIIDTESPLGHGAKAAINGRPPDMDVECLLTGLRGNHTTTTQHPPTTAGTERRLGHATHTTADERPTEMGVGCLRDGLGWNQAVHPHPDTDHNTTVIPHRPTINTTPTKDPTDGKHRPTVAVTHRSTPMYNATEQSRSIKREKSSYVDRGRRQPLQPTSNHSNLTHQHLSPLNRSHSQQNQRPSLSPPRRQTNSAYRPCLYDKLERS